MDASAICGPCVRGIANQGVHDVGLGARLTRKLVTFASYCEPVGHSLRACDASPFLTCAGTVNLVVTDAHAGTTGDCSVRSAKAAVDAELCCEADPGVPAYFF